MKFSVVVPVYNAAAFLSEALDSVDARSGQQFGKKKNKKRRMNNGH